MVFLQRLLVGFGNVDPDQVGVVLVSLPVGQTLEQDLYEAEAPAGKEELVLSGGAVLTYTLTGGLRELSPLQPHQSQSRSDFGPFRSMVLSLRLQDVLQGDVPLRIL